MTAPSVADYRWLVGDEAAPWLDARRFETDQLKLVTQLRKELSTERAALVAEQIRLRLRATSKFPHAGRMFFTARGLEQATDLNTAAYKARRFTARGPLADLCCGVGGDLIALGVCDQTTGYDADEPTAIFAEANCRMLRAAFPGGFHACAQIATADARHVAEVDAWHIDPDRRPTGKRTTQVELHEPSAATIEALLTVNSNAAIKLAPATDPPLAWRERAEWEWIARDGECKQLVAWFGGLTRDVGTRRATALCQDAIRSFSGIADDDVSPANRREYADRLGRFLFEPDAAVYAAKLTNVVAREFDLISLHAGGYLTGDVPHVDPAVAAFEILDALPFDVRKVRALLQARHTAPFEIKKRGVDVDLDQIRKQLKLEAEVDPACSLILARCGDRVTALLTRRLTSTVT